MFDSSLIFQITARAQPSGVNVQNLPIGHSHNSFMVFSGLRDMDMQALEHNHRIPALNIGAGQMN
ncbi:hypothetical protein [Yersinia canariae]|uniref:hypothetical protein n=1 Tax=Yersinia canariae TaxID=2607663 RepID=UPI0011A9B6A7|nr:hypothetical protein [Yersinia canariae]